MYNSSSLTTTKACKTPSNDIFRRPLGSIVKPTSTEISKASHHPSINAKSHRHSKTFSMHPIRPVHKSAYLHMMDTYEEILPNTRGEDRPGYYPLSGLLPLSTTASKTHSYHQPVGDDSTVRSKDVSMSSRSSPIKEACERLIGALSMEWSDEWITGRRYLDMTDLKQNL